MTPWLMWFLWREGSPGQVTRGLKNRQKVREWIEDVGNSFKNLGGGKMEQGSDPSWSFLS